MRLIIVFILFFNIINIGRAQISSDSIQSIKDISFYDTSSIYTKNWLVNVPFAHEDKSYKASLKINFTDSIRGYSYPIEKPMTSGFGKRHGSYHKGIDIPLKTGEKIHAAFDGKVRYAKYNSGGFGWLVIIRHPNGTETFYAHLSKIKVKVNQIVKAGDVIGLGGNTGRSYGAHLHFEIRYHDRPINPEHIFDTENYCLKIEEIMVGELILNKSPNIQPIITEEFLAKGSIYMIKQGDTLSKISARTGMSINEICALNGIQRDDILRIGQKIKIVQ